MKVLHINSLPNGSTGKIMTNISNILSQDINCESLALYGNWKKCGRMNGSAIRFGFKSDNYISKLLYKYSGNSLLGNYLSTISLLNRISRFSPDIVHLHNIHLSVVNYGMLFSYLKKHNIRVIWTLHDCWAFTGRCPYFEIVNCKKWITGCTGCQYPNNEYPQTNKDKTLENWKKKKELFNSIDKLIIVTPSVWLAQLVKQSFLKGKDIRVINNGIDLNVFYPIDSTFRIKYDLQKNNIVLGVAFDWGYRKGLDIFVELSKRLPSNYQIVLVGTNEIIDKELPSNIISIHRTNNQREMAEIYTAADIFFNPTREDNYPTVNMEAIACGTPVITFNTGGSPEMLSSETGIVLAENTVECAYESIIEVCERSRFNKDDCIKRARSFDMNERFNEYIRLYEEVFTT